MDGAINKFHTWFRPEYIVWLNSGNIFFKKIQTLYIFKHFVISGESEIMLVIMDAFISDSVQNYQKLKVCIFRQRYIRVFLGHTNMFIQ